MSRQWMSPAAVVAALLLAIPAPAAEAWSSAGTAAVHAAVAECTAKWRAVQRVAVRRPGPHEGPVATLRSPVHHYLRKGQTVRSCVVAVARTQNGPAYRACGRAGRLWRIVPGGQVPQTCLKRA